MDRIPVRVLILSALGVLGLQEQHVGGEYELERQAMILNRHPTDGFTYGVYGFAGVCELEVARFYCHVAPHDLFCRSRLDNCLTLKAECIGFESTCEMDSNKDVDPCCECSFADCPLEPEGCALIVKMCGGENGGADGEKFDHYSAIEKNAGKGRTDGRHSIRINVGNGGVPSRMIGNVGLPNPFGGGRSRGSRLKATSRPMVRVSGVS